MNAAALQMSNGPGVEVEAARSSVSTVATNTKKAKAVKPQPDLGDAVVERLAPLRAAERTKQQLRKHNVDQLIDAVARHVQIVGNLLRNANDDKERADYTTRLNNSLVALLQPLPRVSKLQKAIAREIDRTVLRIENAPPDDPKHVKAYGTVKDRAIDLAVHNIRSMLNAFTLGPQSQPLQPFRHLLVELVAIWRKKSGRPIKGNGKARSKNVVFDELLIQLGIPVSTGGSPSAAGMLLTRANTKHR